MFQPIYDGASLPGKLGTNLKLTLPRCDINLNRHVSEIHTIRLTLRCPNADSIGVNIRGRRSINEIGPCGVKVDCGIIKIETELHNLLGLAIIFKTTAPYKRRGIDVCTGNQGR